MSLQRSTLERRSKRRTLAQIATFVAIGMGLWLHWPSVGSGFRADDYVQGAMLRGTFPGKRDALDLFDFASGTPEDTARLLDFGYLPWWTVPDVRLRMWRPLSSAIMAADHERFGWHAKPMHLHSLVWFSLVIIAAALVLRRLLSPAASALCILMFAVEEGFTVPIGWLANRNTLIATALGFLCVAAHVRYRRNGHVRFGIATSMFAVTALAAGEYALSALAYVFAYECTIARDSLAARARALLPTAVPVALYLVLHSLFDADVVGSGFYISPVRAPLSFLSALFTRVPVLVADLLFGLPSSFYNFNAPWRNWVLSLGLFSPKVWNSLPDWPTWNVLIGYAALAALFWITRITQRAYSEYKQRIVGFFTLGSVLALVPVAGSLPGDRLVVAGALGICALAAMLITAAVSAPRAASTSDRLVRGAIAIVLFGILGVQSALRTEVQASYFAAESESLRVWALDADVPKHDVSRQRVYVLGSADFTTSANLPWLRLVHGTPPSRSYRRLCPASTALDITRLDANTIEMMLLTHEARGNAIPSLYRDYDRPIRSGFRTQLDGLSVLVTRSLAGNPLAMRFTFDQNVDDESLWFLHSTSRGLRRVRMPAMGERMRLPRPVMMNLRASGLAPPGNFAE